MCSVALAMLFWLDFATLFHWKKHYATEATRALINHLFQTTSLNRLWADHDSRNVASGKVLLKSGMLYEGTARQCYMRKGYLVDKVSYAILREDWVSL